CQAQRLRAAGVDGSATVTGEHGDAGRENRVRAGTTEYPIDEVQISDGARQRPHRRELLAGSGPANRPECRRRNRADAAAQARNAAEVSRAADRSAVIRTESER